MSALVDLGGDRVKWTLWKFYLTAHLRGFHVPAGVFFTKRKICLFWLYRQKHFRGIMMYRLMPRLLPRPNMNFYLAWKRRSIQKWVSAIYYYCVQRKNILVSCSGRFYRSCSLMTLWGLAHCAVLHFTGPWTKQVCWFGPRKWQQFLVLHSFLSLWLAWAASMWQWRGGGSCAGNMLVKGVPALLCSVVTATAIACAEALPFLPGGPFRNALRGLHLHAALPIARGR